MSFAHRLSSPRLSLSHGLGVTLQPDQARTLRVPAAGLLRVTQGALWVTRCSARFNHTPDDVYVAAGQPLALRAGETVVIEPIRLGATPAARVMPATFHWQPSVGRCTSALHRFARRLNSWLHSTQASA